MLAYQGFGSEGLYGSELHIPNKVRYTGGFPGRLLKVLAIRRSPIVIVAFAWQRRIDTV
jgi:hypothetical protein